MEAGRVFVVQGQEGEFFRGAGCVEGGDCVGEGGLVETEFGCEFFDCGGGFGLFVGCVEDPAGAELGGMGVSGGWMVWYDVVDGCSGRWAWLTSRVR